VGPLDRTGKVSEYFRARRTNDPTRRDDFPLPVLTTPAAPTAARGGDHLP